ncbi:MAG: polyprenyl synthetase family protein [Anaerolineaceae bacterium]|nr:polyprenyl synthetase family protein [Anaerolineaceae bacterium]
MDLSVDIPSLEESWRISRAKSGDLIGLACLTSSHLATEDHQKIELLTQYGHNIGLIIQISDDIEGIMSKRGGDDLAAGKWGLPAAYTFNVLYETEGIVF